MCEAAAKLTDELGDSFEIHGRIGVGIGGHRTHITRRYDSTNGVLSIGVVARSPSLRAVVVAFGLVCLGVVGGLGGCHRRAAVPDGDVAATLSAKSLGQHAFDPASLKGKPSIVMFVSPVCPHCLKEMPIAAKVAHEADANVLAIFVVGKPQNATDIAQHFAGTSLWDDGTLKAKYAIKAVPYTLVLGPDGHAVSAYEGAQDESTLRDAIADAR